jgi:LmbE family N-acetylglucosaminyl deacetylase
LNLLPEELRSQFRKNARTRNISKLKDYIDLREFILENERRLREDNAMMRVYSEAGADMMVSVETVRKNLRIIREYEPKLLYAWAKQGISFDHIETANALMSADRPAKEILDDAIDKGDEQGRVMTVDQMVQYVTGGDEKMEFWQMAEAFLSKLSKWKFENWNGVEFEMIDYHIKEIRRIVNETRK